MATRKPSQTNEEEWHDPKWDQPTRKPDHISQEAWDKLIAGDTTFAEIKAMHGEEVAIQAGIARDPDTFEWTAEVFARAKPAHEVHPELEAQPDKQKVAMRIDADIVDRLRSTGRGWQTRLNAALRQLYMETNAVSCCRCGKTLSANQAVQLQGSPFCLDCIGSRWRRGELDDDARLEMSVDLLMRLQDGILHP